MYIFFDIETTGLPKDYKAPVEHLDNWPRVIQLAWQVYDEFGLLMKERSCLIKPDGWDVPTDPLWADNGHNQVRSNAFGFPIQKVLSEFIADRSAQKFSIAHNISFDSKILRSEMVRAGMTTEFSSEKICTMRASTSYCKMPGSRGFKWPKLDELYWHLFQETFKTHDALSDTKACARCFFELKKLGVINPIIKSEQANPFEL